jgi:DNA-binding CsgD family transcriptional regulator
MRRPQNRASTTQRGVYWRRLQTQSRHCTGCSLVPARESFSRHVEVELVDDGTGLLHSQSSYTRGEGGALITVLELQRDQCAISEETLTALTPREREVALLVIDGCSDREISQRLYLSRHTVSQYVKRIYRKLDVTSRVALTRLLLDLRDSRMRD